MRLHYDVKGNELLAAGEASSNLKRKLKKLGIPDESIRKIAIATYEAEINMVIHANGGVIDADIFPDRIHVCLKDTGPGIVDIEQAMQEGFSTAGKEARDLGFGAGMGLPNMKKFSDEFRISTEIGKGTLVELIVNF
ncbi:MAG: anti-sigma regulatory factor [Clostridiales bacterium]|nr:anti-sigma regulatory factor [Clostridiales bacterium]